MEEAKENLKLLENELDDNKFFGGDNIGLLDVVCNFIAFWLLVIQEVVEVKLLTEGEFPKLSRWGHGFVNHPIVKENLPSRDKLAEFFRGRLESSNATSK